LRIGLRNSPQSIIRGVIKKRIADERRERLAARISDQLAMLSPEQRAVIRAAIRRRLAAEVGQGLSDRLDDRLASGLGVGNGD
jgi:hypothetical protein